MPRSPWALLRRQAAVVLGAALAWLANACVLGKGEGEVTGVVSAPDCNLDEAAYSLEPTFFGASPVEEQLEIRIQRGADFELVSDGLSILVRDAARVQQELLGVPIDLTNVLETNPNRLVSVTLYLNRTCEPGDDVLPVVYLSHSGSMTFRSIYAPEVNEEDEEIAASLDDVLLTDPSAPDERFARISGDFRFLFVVGRPAQDFP